MYEAGSRVTFCPVDDCDWKLEQTLYEPPTDCLSDIFGLGTMALAAGQHQQWDLERELDKHTRSHEPIDYLRTITRLQADLNALTSLGASTS